MFRLALVIAASIALAGCGSSKLASAPPSPERPGTRVTTKNPNSEKWQAVRPSGQNTTGASFFVCKPLACADRAAVAIQMSRSPTRHPDRSALEKAAKLLATQTRAQDMVMEAASEGDERVSPLSSSVTELRGYQAILAESKRTSRGKVSYLYRGDVFVGLLMIRVLSTSSVRADAKKHFESFIDALDIIDVEPTSGGSPPPQTTSPSEALQPEQ